MKEVDYYFKKLTIFNNSGAFGSDIVKYKLYKGDILLGETMHDIYYNRHTLYFDQQVFIMERHFWKGVIISESETGKKIATVRFSFNIFTGNHSVKINFGKNDCVKFSMKDFVEEKAYKIDCVGLMTDMMLDVLVQNPQPESMLFVRDKPLSGTITAKDHPDPFRTLCVLAAMESFIVYFDRNRNNRYRQY